MLLYLVKHSHPDFGNATRDLSKVMDRAMEAHYKELLRVIKFTLDDKHRVLGMTPKKDMKLWTLKGISDSEFSGDKDTRISVGGYIVYLMGIPIAWRSKAQCGVTLRSTEAEYMAMSKIVKEIRFIIQVFNSIELKVNLPVEIHVDNVGEIFLATNNKLRNSTKHIDMRCHFIREYIENGQVVICFIRSEENDSDILKRIHQVRRIKITHPNS